VRMRISPSYFSDSPIGAIFDLSAKPLEFLIEKSPPDLLLKLIQLDVWSRVCLYGLPPREVLHRLKRYVSLPLTAEKNGLSKVKQVASA
jgi:hypothetical protein